MIKDKKTFNLFFSLFYGPFMKTKNILFIFLSLFSLSIMAATTPLQKELNTTPLKTATKESKMEPKTQAEIDFNKGAQVFKKENLSPADEKEAFKYFKLSADGGYAPAAYNVGMMYISGSGVEQSTPSAIKYLKIAAEKNEVKSQATLGVIYLLGEYGQEKNPKEAHKFFEQVVKNNTKEANQLITGIALKYNDLPGEENKKEGFKLFKTAADRGETNAEYYVGVAYKDGNGTEKNNTQAVQYFLKSANGGNPFAIIKLSEMSQTGQGLPKNKIKSLALAYVAGALVPKALPIQQALEVQATPKEQAEAKKMAVQIIKERRIDKFLGIQIKK